jgi:hypothetical protein
VDHLLQLGGIGAGQRAGVGSASAFVVFPLGRLRGLPPMTTRPHPITLAWIALVAACSNKAELHTAQRSVYDADFATVYTETMTAVQKLYPNFQEDAAKGVIQTSWHSVPYAASTDDTATAQTLTNPMGYGNPMVNQMPAAGATPTTGGVLVTKRYFIRFDVAVIGGRPWRVHVVGHASEWDPGNATPTEMHGANTPHWLAGRTDELVVAIYKRLERYAKPGKDELPEEHPDDEPKIDVAVFGPIAPGAAAAAGELERAVEKRDYGALRGLVADDVQWSLGADPGADAALATWQADPSTLDALVATMKQGCRGDDKKVVCPAQAATDGYLGWRAVLEPRGATWKLASFVKLE